MPGWAITAVFGAIVVGILLAAGGPDPVLILAVVFLWFVLLAGLALAFETLTQALGRLLRRGP